MQAIILAGGKGVRLRPYTMVLPKPLMPVYERPIIEIIVRHLIRSGISEVIISSGYLHHLIRAFFGNGTRYKIPIRYVVEKKPLGTAGSISLVDGLKDNFIVINGDTLCDIDINAMLQQHNKDGNDVTIGSYKMRYKIDLGVLEIDENQRLIGYKEKPEMKYAVSMGVYIFNTSVLSNMTHGEKLDLPAFVLRLREQGYHVGCYNHPGIWLDIGRPTDFARVNEDETLYEELKSLLEE